MNNRALNPHRVVINALKEFNLPYDEKGVCFGISVLKSLAFLSKDTRVPLALERMAAIPPHTLKTLVTGLVMKGEMVDPSHFNQAQQNLAKEGNTLTEQEAATILTILQTVSIAHFPHQFTELSSSFTTQIKSADAVSQFLQPASLVPQERDEEGYELPGVTPIEKINLVKADNETLTLLKNLRSVFKSSLSNEERVSILLLNLKKPFLHAIMLGYDAEKNEWTYEDYNKQKKIFQDENLLYAEILNSFRKNASPEFYYYLYAANPQTAKKVEAAIPVYLDDCSKLASGGVAALTKCLNDNDYPGFIALLQKNASFAPYNQTLPKLNDFALKLALIEKYYPAANPQRAQALKNIQIRIMESYQLYLQRGFAGAAFDNLIKNITDIRDEVIADHEKHGTFSNITLFGKSFSLTSSELAGYIQTTLDEAIANRDSMRLTQKK